MSNKVRVTSNTVQAPSMVYDELGLVLVWNDLTLYRPRGVPEMYNGVLCSIYGIRLVR